MFSRKSGEILSLVTENLSTHIIRWKNLKPSNIQKSIKTCFKRCMFTEFYVKYFTYFI